MEFNRNQYFFAGVLVLLIGLQVRMISSFELSSEASRMLAEGPAASSQSSQFSFASAQQTIAPQMSRKVIEPPEWLGWCLISVGAVLGLHSLAMKKPD
ncbi:MAG: hypothetical protein AAF596_02045 [Planctomycetota bacterium]